MKLSVKNYETRLGKAIRVEGYFDEDFYKKFLSKPIPYAFSCFIPSADGKTAPSLGHCIYLTNSEEHKQIILDNLVLRISEAGHNLEVL